MLLENAIAPTWIAFRELRGRKAYHERNRTLPTVFDYPNPIGNVTENG